MEMNLPDPLKDISNLTQWGERRKTLLETYRREVYGAVPPMAFSWTIGDRDKRVLMGGFATMEQIELTLSCGERSASLHLLLFLPGPGCPSSADGHPLFLGLNFSGNHTVFPDPAIELPRPDKSPLLKGSPSARGCNSNRWPISRIMERGYGVATLYAGDVDPDFHDGFLNGVHGLNQRREGEWGTISAWAWGLSRVMDYLETRDDIDRNKVALTGHSRLGKTALWAAAQDTRFSMVYSSCSGCGGASLFRHAGGETIRDITATFPHWFNENFTKYACDPNRLPLDQHFLLSLIAPRPVYVASASEDDWADPEGEYIALLRAGPIYELFDKERLPLSPFPSPGEIIHTPFMGYHLREGKHDMTPWDWERLMDFREDL